MGNRPLSDAAFQMSSAVGTSIATGSAGADSRQDSASAAVAGCRPLIHSRIAHESRTRVFTLTLPFLVSCEGAHQVARGGRTPQFLPRRLLGQHTFLPAHCQ